jgi:hypothetical protein
MFSIKYPTSPQLNISHNIETLQQNGAAVRFACNKVDCGAFLMQNFLS